MDTIPPTDPPVPPTGPPGSPAAFAVRPPGIDEEACGKVLAMPARWRMLRALAREGALPAGALAGAGKCSPQMATKHIACLKKYGLIERRHRSLYALVPRFAPAPGAASLDLGPCHIVL